ncbi:hypothetical protein PUN28_009327 [Cardiocondyla obscurior]|uniref:Uncharacterized protein n=1 Tax=Cardiocondyla obscurior TaxID=286306 RepID=A0AAW2FRH9_9HYME
MQCNMFRLQITQSIFRCRDSLVIFAAAGPGRTHAAASIAYHSLSRTSSLRLSISFSPETQNFPLTKRNRPRGGPAGPKKDVSIVASAISRREAEKRPEIPGSDARTFTQAGWLRTAGQAASFRVSHLVAGTALHRSAYFSRRRKINFDRVNIYPDLIRLSSRLAEIFAIRKSCVRYDATCREASDKNRC